jgi:hypothetical protein
MFSSLAINSGSNGACQKFFPVIPGLGVIKFVSELNLARDDREDVFTVLEVY